MTEADTDTAEWDDAGAALPGPRDPDVVRVRRLVEARLLGDPLVPITIGRFALLERIAAGGMGVVFAAYDRELDRKVALKLLRSDRDHEAERGRIVREAQAMAKLSHPNVAHVYEVGEHEGRTFIAMELVLGKTLRAWQRASPRSIDDTVAAYVQAGRGLQSAHAAGLVHRDFKPDNAVVGVEGRVRVVDFGLALGGADDDDALVVETLPTDVGRTLRSAVGGAGSPAYMAPEQHARADVDARADQFAFCVSLWEAVFGERPFAGGVPSAIALAIAEGPPRMPARPRVPARLYRLLVRGLRVDPRERHPSMDVLLDALQRDRQASVRRSFVGVAAVGLTGVVVWTIARGPDPSAACEANASLADVWNAERADELRASFRATGKPYAIASADAAAGALDEWSAAWTAAHVDACRATHVEHSRSHAQLEAQLACLGRGRGSAVALFEVLASADATALEHANDAIAALPSIDRCADVRRVERDPIVAESDRAAADAVFAEAERTHQLVAAGAYDRALATAEAAVPAATSLGYPHVEARLRRALAEAHATLRAYDRAAQEATHALALAIEGGDDELAMTITSDLVYLDGYQRGRRELGDAWIAQAESWLLRIDRPWDLERELLVDRGYAARTADRLDDALADFERALALQMEHGPDDESERAAILAAIGNTQRMLGRLAEARVTMEEVVAVSEQLFGPEHPHVANEINTLASVHMDAGDFARAEPMFERAIAIDEAALPPSSSQLRDARANLGIVYANTGRLDAAIAVYEEIVRDLPGDFASGDGTEVKILGNMCMMLMLAGNLERAEAIWERSLVGAREISGEGSFDHGMVLVTGVSLAIRRDHPTLALQRAQDAIAIFVETLGEDHVQTGFARMWAAHALVGLERHEEAIVSAERALVVLEAAVGPKHTYVAGALHALGAARLGLGRHDAARDVLERALAFYREIEATTEIGEVEALLSRLPPVR